MDCVASTLLISPTIFVGCSGVEDWGHLLVMNNVEDQATGCCCCYYYYYYYYYYY
jgi:hypothetical protein